jgi:hypothetical protein
MPWIEANMCRRRCKKTAKQLYSEDYEKQYNTKMFVTIKSQRTR